MVHHRFCAISSSLLCLLWCPPGHAQTCSDGKYLVTTTAQLENALGCVASDCVSPCLTCSGSCPTEIVIPAGTNINVANTIVISSAHNGVTLTINGSLTWTGSANGLIIYVGGASNVTIRGSGLITSIHTPTQSASAPTAISVDGCTNVAVEGLTVMKANDMVSVGNVASNGVTLRNLTGEILKGYGVYVGSAPNTPFPQNVIIDGCSVEGISPGNGQHGVRVAAYGVTITDCEAFDFGSMGFWVQEGSNAVVDGFVTNRECRVGPNYASQDVGQRFRCAQVRNVTTTFIDTGGNSFRVMLGTLGCFMEDISAPGKITVHTRESQYVELPTDRVHWRNLNVDEVSVIVESRLCHDYGPCLGDITNDDMVDVDDLLAIVNNWGACPPPIPSSNECYQCLSDIEPYHCGNGVVDVDDLLTVINDWGCTYTTLGNESNAPQSVVECEDACAEQVGAYGTPEWWECYETCVDGLCRAGIIECD